MPSFKQYYTDLYKPYHRNLDENRRRLDAQAVRSLARAIFNSGEMHIKSGRDKTPEGEFVRYSVMIGEGEWNKLPGELAETREKLADIDAKFGAMVKIAERLAMSRIGSERRIGEQLLTAAGRMLL